MISLDLQILAGTLALSRLPADAPAPEWARGELVALTRTADELSVVSSAAFVPDSVQSDSGWRAIRVEGRLDPDLVGILAELSRVLAEAEIPLFALSTFGTDYLLVRGHTLPRAVQSLESAGHRVVTEGSPGGGSSQA